MTASNEVYQDASLTDPIIQSDQKKLINVLVMFTFYILFISALLILGIFNGLVAATLIAFGAALMFGMFWYNAIREQETDRYNQTLLGEIKRLRDEAADDSTDASGSDVSTDVSTDVYVNSGIITSSDSNVYGICPDGEPLFEKYLDRYNLLDHSEEGTDLPDDTAIKHIKITFPHHVMGSWYKSDEFLQLADMVRPGDSTKTYPDDKPGVVPVALAEDEHKNDDLKSLVTISQIQIIEQTTSKSATVDGAYDTDGLVDLAPGSDITLSSGTTETPVDSISSGFLNNNHATPKNAVDGSLNTFYFGGMREYGYGSPLDSEEDGIMLTLNVAKSRNDLASIVIYTPIAGCMKHARLHLLNGAGKLVTNEPIPFNTQNYMIYGFKFGALGGKGYVDKTIGDAKKVRYHRIIESISDLVPDTRQEYAENHFSDNRDNVYNCTNIVDEVVDDVSVAPATDDTDETSEGFITRLNEVMFGPATDVAKKFNVQPVSSDLL